VLSWAARNAAAGLPVRAEQGTRWVDCAEFLFLRAAFGEGGKYEGGEGMSKTAKIGLVALLVAIVASVVIWDRISARNARLAAKTPAKQTVAQRPAQTPEAPGAEAIGTGETAATQTTSETPAGPNDTVALPSTQPTQEQPTPQPGTTTETAATETAQPADTTTQPADTTATTTDQPPVQPETIAVTIGGSTHKVVANDSLWKIAKQYYNSGSDKYIDLIFEANRDKMKGRDSTLKLGWALTIPEVTVERKNPNANTQTATSATVSGGSTHKVVANDSLWKIAKQYYNSGSDKYIDMILEANRDKLSSKSSTLKLGWTLAIPAAPGAQAATTDQATTAVKPRGKIPADLEGRTDIYQVKANDSLDKLARRFYKNSSMTARIFEANKGRLKDPNVLREGQWIVIPDMELTPPVDNITPPVQVPADQPAQPTQPAQPASSSTEENTTQPAQPDPEKAKEPGSVFD
jgi:nucleoid-associated protein YgaU